jgi:hypothetical protein
MLQKEKGPAFMLQSLLKIIGKKDDPIRRIRSVLEDRPFYRLLYPVLRETIHKCV